MFLLEKSIENLEILKQIHPIPGMITILSNIIPIIFNTPHSWGHKIRVKPPWFWGGWNHQRQPFLGRHAALQLPCLAQSTGAVWGAARGDRAIRKLMRFTPPDPEDSEVLAKCHVFLCAWFPLFASWREDSTWWLCWKPLFSLTIWIWKKHVEYWICWSLPGAEEWAPWLSTAIIIWLTVSHQ